ncbi:Plus3 domain-containing protein [Abeliophyllum distichum]|uniref:Plus3 domain-containing protein n=1 Tax=Abeliophyllum distichum TaxID=126358 RepID=A0ABD1PCZ6_9LAMI
MSSGSDDSQSWSDVRTNPSIQGESPLSSSSSEVVGKVNQASPASCPSTTSTNGREVSPTVPLKKIGGRKRTDVGVPEMRRSLDKRNDPAVRALDEELRCSATEASMARSRITAEELEDLQLSYDVPSSVLLRASGPEERADDPTEGFVVIYEPAMQQGLCLSMHPFFREVLKDWNLAPCQITPNGWGQMVTSYLLWVVVEAGGNLTPREFDSIYRPCRSSGWYNISPRPDCGKPPILKRNQGELRSKWDNVRALSSEFRSLNNLLKDDNLLASCGVMAFRFKGVPVICLARPASGEGSSTQASRQEASGKKVVEGAEEAPSHKRKAPTTTEGLMRDARKARRTEEGRRSSPSLDGEPEGVENPVPSAGQNYRIRISERREELPASVMEMLPTHPSIVAASVHRYWTSSWKKVAEEATIPERLQLAEVNLVRGLVLAKEIFSALASFDAEDSKSKKLAEIELKAAKECLKQARDQKRAAEASQNCVEEAQKLAEDRTLAAETVLAAANSSLKAVAADNERSLSVTKLELEKIKTERADAEARAVEAYQDAFVDTPEYQDLAQYRMTVGGAAGGANHGSPSGVGSLFFREAPVEAHVSEADPGDSRRGDEGLSCADP